MNRAACLLLLVVACAPTRAPLPPPVSPLAPTPDASLWREPPPLSPSVALAVPEVHGQTLDNGLVVWSVQRPDTTTSSLVLVIGDGGSYDTTRAPELMGLLSRAIVEGGLEWIDGQLVMPPSVRGRMVGEHTSPEASFFDLDVPADAFPSAMTLLARTVLHPALGRVDLLPVRVSVVAALQNRTNSDFNQQLALALEHRYGRACAERVVPMNLHVVKEAEAKELEAIYRAHYVPEHSALIAVGPTPHAEVVAAAEREFGSWARGKARPSKPAPPVAENDGVRVHFFPASADMHQARVQLMQRAPSTVDELPAFDLPAELAVASFRSRVSRDMRHERGITYGVRPDYVRGPGLRLMTVRAAIMADETETGLEALMGALDTLQAAPVAPEELDTARTALKAALRRTFDDASALSGHLSALFAEGQPVDFLARYVAQLEAATPADLTRVAGRYLDTKNMEIGVTGPWMLDAALRSFGRVERYTVGLR